ncbi:helix-turn-helix transcriptional regulator [Liquorilactobacillus hordei]|uniref:helix-turn-helix transcriptional regulator n=1 Tax=Liquorilactobacillus hordei TaxID=468911 RepID=UPI001CBEDA00|nr:helix-turn-helix transcriptional regulator [Liquorilactobacillus hordei]MBZ2406042.1 XRE family transcriptional regulator [Liquorilactobacillus hordei]
MTFSKSLKELRLLHELSQTQLAKKLNVSPKTISNWENERNLPDIELIIKISKVLDVTLDELIIGNNQLENKIIKDSHKIFRDNVMAIVVSLYSTLTGMLAMVWFLNIQTPLRIIIFSTWLFVGFVFGYMIELTDNKNPFDSISPILRCSFIALFIVLGLSLIIGSFWLIIKYPQKMVSFVTMIVGVIIIIMTKPIWPIKNKNIK